MILCSSLIFKSLCFIFKSKFFRKLTHESEFFSHIFGHIIMNSKNHPHKYQKCPTCGKNCKKDILICLGSFIIHVLNVIQLLRKIKHRV